LDVLADPIFAVRTPAGVEHCGLRQVLALLLVLDESPVGFDGLAAEQASHWYRFLARCGAKALRTIGADPGDMTGRSIGEVAGEIGDALVYAAGSREAWFLVAQRPAVPAFLQVPVAEDRRPEEENYKPRHVSLLTALIGSKEFERKSEAARAMTSAEVVYALIEYQGGAIFGGRGNYETPLTPSRSGKGSGVPFMGVRMPGGLGATFRWDVSGMLAEWDRVRSVHGLGGDVWALWTQPWDGTTSLPATSLDPAFIPLARMVRLQPPDDGGFFHEVLFRPSAASRVSDHTGGGMLGDPFTPTVASPKDPTKRKVRGVMEGGFTYTEVARLLGFAGHAEGQPSASVSRYFATPGAEFETGVVVLFEGVAFEQGKTLGFYRRELLLPVPREASMGFRDPEPFRAVHAWMLERVTAAKKALRGAARILLTGERRPRRGDDALVGLAPDLLDGFADVGDAYLTIMLQGGAGLAEGDLSYQETWAAWLVSRTRAAFQKAKAILPVPGAQRFRREVAAEDYLEWGLRRLRGEEGVEARGLHQEFEA
jgi:hypothetical protein